jgi:hypothetical protein
VLPKHRALVTESFKKDFSQAWWYMTVITAFGRPRNEEYKFEASLDYTARSCLKTKTIRFHKTILRLGLWFIDKGRALGF